MLTVVGGVVVTTPAAGQVWWTATRRRVSEFGGLWKYKSNQHALVPPKTEYGGPNGEGLKTVTYATPPMEECGGRRSVLVGKYISIKVFIYLFIYSLLIALLTAQGQFSHLFKHHTSFIFTNTSHSSTSLHGQNIHAITITDTQLNS